MEALFFNPSMPFARYISRSALISDVIFRFTIFQAFHKPFKDCMCQVLIFEGAVGSAMTQHKIPAFTAPVTVSLIKYVAIQNIVFVNASMT